MLRLKLWCIKLCVVFLEHPVNVFSGYRPLTFVAGRYAIRYGRVAGEAVRKQMASIPSGLVSDLSCSR